MAKSAKKKASSGLVALAILLAVWAVILLVGYFAGMFSGVGADDGGQVEEPIAAEAIDAATEAATDAASEQAESAASTDTGQPQQPDQRADAGTQPQEQEPENPTPIRSSSTLTRYLTCERGTTAALRVADLVGDEGAELLVACGGQVHVVGVDRQWPPRLMRVAKLEIEGASDGDRAARPSVGDVTGDGSPDVVFGHTSLGPGSEPTGGALLMASRVESGALELSSRRLGAGSTLDIAIGNLDGSSAQDIVVARWTDSLGRVPSEVAPFLGGTHPTRRPARRVGQDIAAVSLGDFNGDGNLDAVAIDADGARMLMGDGRGNLRALDPIAVPGAADVVTGDVDGDGLDDAVVLGQGLHLIQGESESVFAAEPINAPQGLKRVVLTKLDSDDRIDLLAIRTERVLALLQTGRLQFTEREIASLPPNLRGTDLGVSGDELAVLARSAAGWEIVLMNTQRGGLIDGAATPAALSNAPLFIELTGS